MARLVLAILAVFIVLAALRILRACVDGIVRRFAATRRPPPVEAELVRDPVCGAWVDRRAAVTAWRAGRPLDVCSDACRRMLEAG